MNLPNKITMVRVVMAIMIIVILLFPWHQVGDPLPEILLFGKILVEPKYLIAGVLFIIASLSDFLDGYIARKNNIVTDFGKVMDAIADKVLVNGVLIVLSANGFIPIVIPVVIITRDTIVDCIKMIAGSKGGAVGASILGKIKTVCMMIGLALTLFYNIPFELVGLRVAEVLLIIATILSIVSGCQYYLVNKDTVFKEK